MGIPSIISPEIHAYNRHTAKSATLIEFPTNKLVSPLSCNSISNLTFGCFSLKAGLICVLMSVARSITSSTFAAVKSSLEYCLLSSPQKRAIAPVYAIVFPSTCRTVNCPKGNISPVFISIISSLEVRKLTNATPPINNANLFVSAHQNDISRYICLNFI